MNEKSINLLKSYLAKKGHTQEGAARVIGNTVSVFNKKLHGITLEFNRQDMLKLIAYYGISKKDAVSIFLSEKCLEQDK